MPGKRKHRGKSAMRASGKSPYTRHKKAAYLYPSDYKDNYLDEQGRLCRRGQPVVRKERHQQLEAAE